MSAKHFPFPTGNRHFLLDGTQEVACRNKTCYQGAGLRIPLAPIYLTPVSKQQARWAFNDTWINMDYLTEVFKSLCMLVLGI